MSDIKLTLSKKSKRAPSIEEEARWMEEEGPLFYPLGANRPRAAQPGCWVYFIRDRQLVARAHADKFVLFDKATELHSYSGMLEQGTGWHVQCSRMELARVRPPAGGFQGFWYVRGQEQSEFESAFEPYVACGRQLLGDEVDESQLYHEGTVRQISVNAYERDPAARSACLAHYGTDCAVCGFSFQEVYGEIGEGSIHVHHLIPLAAIGRDYVVDAINDLRPVCPNCHAVIHLRRPPHSIKEVRHMLRRQDTT